MFDRYGRVAWLLAAFALTPVASDAGDTQSTPKTQSRDRTEAAQPSAPAAADDDGPSVTGTKVDTSKPSSATAEAARATPAGADSEVDDELLEFLGTVDSDDSAWLEYLSRTDKAASAKTRQRMTQDK
jgi:hypothetical protein